MCSQNLENSYQITIMSESENMSLKEEESQEHNPSSQDQDQDFESVLEVEDEVSDSEGEESEVQEEESEVKSDEGIKADEDKKEKRKKEPKEASNSQFDEFLKQFQEEQDVEKKLQSAIDFMESSLAQGGSPHFRNFWEARRICLPLFKENISPALRSQLWGKYSELSKEARRLKDILDEQSAFAVEQIEIAIKALEENINQFDEEVSKAAMPEETHFPQALKSKHDYYENLQKQLNILNVQASRINALRKELLKTEMRVRQKNKFFQRLSSAGDRVFPRRKELIKEISQHFMEDVDHFIKEYFREEMKTDSLYVLREEIKLFQGLAKSLTLNTNSFTQTRMRLSECWDKIKVKEKERKKERAQQRATFKQNADLVYQQIEALRGEIQEGNYTVTEAQNKTESILSYMRQVELGRDEIKKLREELSLVRKLIQDRIRQEEDVRKQQEQERARQKKEIYKQLKEQAEQLVTQHEQYSIEELMLKRDDILAQTNEAPLTKMEKVEIDRVFKPLRDIISEKKEQSLLELSEDDRQMLQQLKEVLRQRKERRQEIKNQLEVYRKKSGSSSLDFEQAMAYTTQINEEKERLEKASHGIKEIEDKINQLQSKMRS